MGWRNGEREGERERKKRGGMNRRKGNGRNMYDPPQGNVCTTDVATQVVLGKF